MSPKEVSSFLRLSLDTLTKWRKRHPAKLPFIKYSKSTIRYHLEDVENFKKTIQKSEEKFVKVDFSEKAIRERLRESSTFFNAELKPIIDELKLLV